MIKKTLVLGLILCLGGFSASAQDLIVTKAGDSLRVKIIEELSASIYFSQNTTKGKAVEQRIFKTLIKDFKYNFFESAVPDERLKEESRGEIVANDFSNYLRWRSGFSLGYWMPTEVSSFENTAYGKYLEKLERGILAQGLISFYPIEKVGLGILYHRNGSKNTDTKIDFTDFDGSKTLGPIRDQKATLGIGPNISVRQFLNYRSFISFSGHASYLIHHENIKRSSQQRTKGTGNGWGLDLAYDRMQGNTAIGFDSGLSFGLHFNSGNILELNNKTLNKPLTPFKFNYYGASFGIMFYKIPKYLKLTSY